MNFLFLALIFCFFIFLYIVHSLSRDDFVILRSNASMEKIFNAAFLSAFFGLFIARLLFVIFNPRPVFFNPLGFLLFPYFPGLSLIGGLIGGFVISSLILKVWALPVGRILDFFSMGFLASFSFGFLGTFILSGEKISLILIFSLVSYLSLLFIFIKFVLPLSLNGKFKDGSLSLLFMVSFSMLYLISNLTVKLSLSYENVFSILTILVSLVLFIQKENFVRRYLIKTRSDDLKK